MMPSGGAVTQPVCQTDRWDATGSAASAAARPRRMADGLSLQSRPPSDIVTSMYMALVKYFPEAHKAPDEKNVTKITNRTAATPVSPKSVRIKKNYIPG